MKKRQNNGADVAIAESAREMAIACELLIAASSVEEVVAEQVVIEKAKALLRALGYGVHVLHTTEAVRGDQPAFRVESTTDYVIRDREMMANILRSFSRSVGTGLCTDEPIEQDPIGMIRDALDLEIPKSKLDGILGKSEESQTIRALTASERRATRLDWPVKSSD